MNTLKRFVCMAALGLSTAAGAQSFPTKPIRVVVPAPPGSSADVLARVISQKLSEKWGQPLVIENKVGDNANVGAEYASRLPSDGYNWVLLPDSTITRSPHLTKLPIDVFRDFTPVAKLATVPFAMVVHPTVPVKSVTELIAYTQANPGRLSYGSSGNGSVQHMLTELFKYSAGGLQMLHVPYKGSGQAITDLLANRINIMIGAAGQLEPYVKDGKLRLLAAAGAHRLPAFPSTPTIAEELPAFGTKMGDPWIGMFMPANVPAQLVSQVNAAIVQTLNDPDTKGSLATKGFDVATSTPAELAATMHSDYTVWGKVIKEAHVVAD